MSQIEGTEDFLRIERKTLREMVIGVRDVLVKGAVKPALPSASSPQEVRISNPGLEFPKSGSEIRRISECDTSRGGDGLVARRHKGHRVPPTLL